MLKAFKYRIYPTAKQEVLINKHIGCSRFVYNLALECKQMAYIGSGTNLTCNDLMVQLPDLKKECAWLKEVNSQSLQQSIIHLDIAYTRFFKGQGDFPKFKKKSARQSFNVPQNVSIEDDKLCVPKLKGIKIVIDRKHNGEIRSATLSRTSTGKYFASVLCDTGDVMKEKTKIKKNTAIGIDLGLKSFIVTSDGQKFDNPRFLKQSIARLKYVHSKYSKYKGKETKHRLAVLHERVANQRRNFLHKTSTKLIRENQTICIEDLNIQGMLKNHCLAGSISDVGWGMFVDMLRYKSEWYGNNLLQIGRFEPSSKTCSCCGAINNDLTLGDREWTCKNCKISHDRDKNAATNIKAFALRNHITSEELRHENRNELPTLVGVQTSEAHLG